VILKARKRKNNVAKKEVIEHSSQNNKCHQELNAYLVKLLYDKNKDDYYNTICRVVMCFFHHRYFWYCGPMAAII
jgi:hypothetical protein